MGAIKYKPFVTLPKPLGLSLTPVKPPRLTENSVVLVMLKSILDLKLNLSYLNNFNSIKYDCTQNYDTLMIQFINKLSNLLRKDNDSEFSKKYLTIIQNLGLFKNELIK